MQTRLRVLLTVALLTWASVSAAAQPPPAEPPTPKPRRISYVSIMKARTGRQALVVNYPWKVHARPSVEVRLVTTGEADPPAIRPSFFVEEYMNGEVRLKIYRAQDEAARAGAAMPLTENEIDFEILGQRNSLGKPAVCVARRLPRDDPAPGTGVVFCLLPSWAVNKALLHLDLPREYFEEAGKIHVWFLRGNEVLWKDKVDWAGYGK